MENVSIVDQKGNVKELVIHPCRVVHRNPSNGMEVCEKCSKSDADFFGVYRVDTHGMERWVSDHNTIEEARDAVHKIKKGG